MDLRKGKSPYTPLIFLCWLVYSASYIGKVSFAANIDQIMSYYDVSHSEAGLVSSCLFFSYAIGQFVNGFFSRKYNVKFVVSLSLLTSALMNFLIPTVNYFPIVKFLWVINGFALSFLWPTLIRFLAESLPRSEMPRASLVMGTTVATGTLFIYALSAIFVNFNFFISFYVAPVVLPVIFVFWVINARKYERLAKSVPEVIEDSIDFKKESAKKGKIPFDIMAVAVSFAFIGIAVNFIAEGLTTWVPSILNESFDVGEALAKVLTIALPLIAVIGNLFAVRLNKMVPNFILDAAICFSVSGVLVLFVLWMLDLKIAVAALIAFAVIRMLMALSNGLVTSVFPLYMKGKVNSGLIAGVLNGFCYVGSTLSTYGLGAIADTAGGWTAVFYTLFFVCIFVLAIYLIYTLITKLHNKNYQN